jgi:hypothetical protein
MYITDLQDEDFEIAIKVSNRFLLRLYIYVLVNASP